MQLAASAPGIPGSKWGRNLARLLCCVFALIGALPVISEVVLRSASIQKWAARETARTLREQLGISANYDVRVTLFPLRLRLENVVLPASDALGPVLSAQLISVTPKIFSLLGGRLDAGDIEIERPNVRLVMQDGKIANLAYRLPKSEKASAPSKRAPFASVALSDGRVSVDFGAWQLRTDGADIDVFTGTGPSFEIAVRTATSHVSHQRSLENSTAYDEDVICQLDLRAELQPERALIRRFELQALTDVNPQANTEPACDAKRLTEADERVAVKLSQVAFSRLGGKNFRILGSVQVRAPVQIAQRYVDLPKVGGWIHLSGQGRFESGQRLPEFKGKLEGSRLDYGPARVAEHIVADVNVTGDVILIPKSQVRWANGDNTLVNTRIAPFEPHAPLSTELLDGKGMNFPGIMRDVGVTPNTIVAWDLTHTRVANIRATLSPFKLRGEFSANTHRFEVTSRAFHDSSREHMIGVKAADLQANLAVDLKSFDLENVYARFGNSTLSAKLVSIGFDSHLGIQMVNDTVISLEDISPLVNIPMAGKARLRVGLNGDPQLTPILGDLAVEGFKFGGFELGDILESKVRFVPLKVDFTNLRGKKGKSPFFIPNARLNFDTEATVVADAAISTKALNIRDFFAMFHFDKDPRFDPIAGTGSFDGRLHYALGGPEDRCGGGLLVVDGASSIKEADLFEEHYTGGSAEFRYEWFDQEASYLGANLDVSSFTLKKGTGTILGNLKMRQGAMLEGSVVGSRLPLSEIDAMEGLKKVALGYVDAVGKVSGSVDQLSVDSTVRVSKVALGTKTLPASAFAVRLRSTPATNKILGKTRCGNTITGPFSETEWEEDKPTGTFALKGELFSGQVVFDGLGLSRQRKKSFTGGVILKQFDLGPWAELSPSLVANDALDGHLSARIDLVNFSTEKLQPSKATFALEELKVRRGQVGIELVSQSGPLELSQGALTIPPMAARVSGVAGENVVVDLDGSVSNLGVRPALDLALRLRPADLGALAALLPRAENVKGTLLGSLRLFGSLDALAYQGRLEIKNGLLGLAGLPSPLSDLNVTLNIEPDEVRVAHGEAKLGGGTLRLSGGSEVVKGSLQHGRLEVKAENVSLPLDAGIHGTFDAALAFTFDSETFGEAKNLPKITGSLDVVSFEYTRPVSMTADIESLAQRTTRTEFDAYDPADDLLELDILVRAKAPIQLKNNLIDAQVLLDPTGLNLTGTNQRFGLRGALMLKPGGRILLRRNEFEIRQGTVRFDNPTRIAPQVDVTAVTDYRRYAQGNTQNSGDSGQDSGTSSRGGRWNIQLHAHGDAERLKIDLSSQPTLNQDDIFLLLTVGLTRAELDQARSASVGESVALEALGTITGADQAVTDVVPVIDDFRLGSAYSSRTGRTEPTVTISKRLAERIRANVTSGLSESREVRSNVEWKVTPDVSLEGSYDNVNDISSSSFGNLGADIRWRLEFE
ncbi:MAG: translocation/assembly module TamB domain-containing protein [Polyangiaceae bacterium]|nr:translocation/assembly module TamB domain-containing protein [Polyangiaceae bacterium]